MGWWPGERYYAIQTQDPDSDKWWTIGKAKTPEDLSKQYFQAVKKTGCTVRLVKAYKVKISGQEEKELLEAVLSFYAPDPQ